MHVLHMNCSVSVRDSATNWTPAHASATIPIHFSCN